MNLKKGFRITTWALSLIAFIGVAVGIDLLSRFNGEDVAWLPIILLAFAAFAGIWVISWVIYWITRFLCRYPVRNIILWSGIIALVLMCIFPPWNKVYRLPSSNIKACQPLGYYPLMRPPYYRDHKSDSGVEIDFSRLFLQLFIVGVITGGLIYTFRDKKGKND